ncbi:hypothetical protein L1887_17958 [Cichorium endivia]|nr:hypothetical protein L1887_17958 [Cichorium endivia]
MLSSALQGYFRRKGNGSVRIIRDLKNLDETTTTKDVVEAVRNAHGYTKEHVKSPVKDLEKRIIEHQSKIEADSEAHLNVGVQNIEASHAVLNEETTKKIMMQ